jgi:outer membrane receptor protein involved in Fe transport
MHPDMTHIDAVQIVAQSQRVEYKIDKKVVNVAQDLAAAGGTLVNVLENTPSVQVDVEGNVTLRGSGNFRLLIDGKPSVIQGSEGLQQIPASAVQNLEIITSPSAKYDPDGDAGIINVIMKKQKNTGIGGVVNASIGTRQKYTTDFLLNFRKDKLNYFVGAEYADQKNFMKGESERRYYGDTSTYQLNDVNGMFYRKSFNIKSGFDYSVTDKSTLSLSGAYNNRSFTREFGTRSHFYTDPFTVDSFFRETSTGGDKSQFYNLNLDYSTKFDDKGHMLKTSVYYSSGSGDESEEDIIRKTNSEYVLEGTEPARTRSRTKEPESNLRVEMDYTRPTKTGKIELGLQSRWEKSDGEYIFEDYQPLGNEWLYNDTISNSLEFRNAMQSVYGTYNGRLGGFEYQAGLRAEYDNRNLTQLTSSESFVYEKLHAFPSFYITRKLSEKHQLQFTYSRRIQRPGKWDLNPFIEYRGSTNVFYGNPALRPQFTDGFELNYQYNLKKGFISLETYYRKTNDIITRISGTEILNGQQVFFNTSINGDKDQSLGIELMANVEPAKWWQLNLTGNLFRYQLDGEVDGETVTSISTTWRTNFNSTFIMGKNMRLQLSGFYNGPSNTLQGQRDGFFVANVALRRDMLKKQLTVSLNARDLFSTGKFAFLSEGADFYTYNKMRRESPVVTLNLSYRLNNYKQAGRRGGEQQEENGGGMDMGM